MGVEGFQGLVLGFQPVLHACIAEPLAANLARDDDERTCCRCSATATRMASSFKLCKTSFFSIPYCQDFGTEHESQVISVWKP